MNTGYGFIKKCVFFVVGFLLGITTLFAFGLYKVVKESGTTLVGDKVFGDIRIFRLDTRSDIPEDNYQNLLLEKNGRLFLNINQSLSGKTNLLFLYNGKNMKPIVTMAVDPETKEWGPLKYGKMGKEGERVEGQISLDFDVDGVVDLFFSYDENANVQDVLAFINDEWKRVTFLDFNDKYIKVEHGEEEIPMYTSSRTKDLHSVEK